MNPLASALEDAGGTAAPRERLAQLRALLGLHREEILAVERRRAAGHLVRRIPREHLHQGALSRSVRAHDRMDFAGRDGERDDAKDLAVTDLGL